MSQNQQVVEATGSILVACINQTPNPGEKMGAAMSVAFNAITTTAAMMMGARFKPHEGVYPSMDHVLLASFLINAGCSLSSDATVRVEFSPERVIEALTDFHKFTGREGESLLDPDLKQMVDNETKIDLSKFGANRKFLQ
jgi:hypothetical protein